MTGDHRERPDTGPARTTGGGDRTRTMAWLLAVVLLLLLGLVAGATISANREGDALSAQRPEDLVSILDGLSRQEDELRRVNGDLTADLERLQGSTDGEALEDARRAADELRVSSGEVPVAGSGVQLRISDPNHLLDGMLLLGVIQELRAAGAEAIELTGADGVAVRVSVTTWVAGEAGDAIADGIRLTTPLTVTAIGDPPTLAVAMDIPGGVTDQVTAISGEVQVSELEQVEIRSTVS